jgi:hypothetical protein
VQDRRVRLQRRLGIDDGRQGLVAHADRLGGILGQVPVAGDDDRHRLAHEAALVGRGRIVVDGRGDADPEKACRRPRRRRR